MSDKCIHTHRFARQRGGLTLSILRGQGGIGGTTLLIELRGHALVVDLGQDYSLWGTYYGPMTGPRACRGVADLIDLGLLPSLGGLYDDAKIPEGYRPRWKRTARVAAVLLTHAHGDHASLLSYVRWRIPVVCSAPCAGWLRFQQMTGGNVPPRDLAHAVPRGPSRHDERALTTETGPSRARPLLLTENPVPGSLEGFWNSPVSEGRAAIPARVAVLGKTIAGIEVQSFAVNHSTNGCRAFAFREADANGPWLVYTGDLKDGPDTEAFIFWLEANEIDRLVCEGTRLGRKERGPTEKDVAAALGVVVERANGLVVVDLPLRNVDRLRALADVARAGARELVVTPRLAHMLECQGASGEKVLRKAPLILDAPSVQPAAWEKRLLRDCAKRLIDADGLRRKGKAYVVACGIGELPDLLDLRGAGGDYVFASSKAYDIQGEDAMRRRLAWAERLEFKVHGLGWEGGDDGCPTFPGSFSASGHISEQDLRRLLRAANAREVYPVHTLEPEMFRKLLRGTRSRLVLGE